MATKWGPAAGQTRMVGCNFGSYAAWIHLENPDSTFQASTPFILQPLPLERLWEKSFLDQRASCDPLIGSEAATPQSPPNQAPMLGAGYGRPERSACQPQITDRSLHPVLAVEASDPFHEQAAQTVCERQEVLTEDG